MKAVYRTVYIVAYNGVRGRPIVERTGYDTRHEARASLDGVIIEESKDNFIFEVRVTND